MHFVSERRDHRLIAVGFASIALALVAVLAFAARSQAAETLFWDNYGDNTLAYANIDGTGGGILNLTGGGLKNPEGIALDVAGGRLFAASPSTGENGQIVFAKIDNSGGGVLNTSPGTVDDPEGVAIDPATGIIYWANEGNGPTDLGSIGYAKLDGSGGGLLNTSGATVENPYKVGIDTVNGRIYWANTGGSEESISYANLNGSGGGNLAISGTSKIEVTGFSVDPAAGRVYWVNDESGDELISYTGLMGGAGGDVPTSGVFNGPYGLSFDPTIGRFYWGNYNGDTESHKNAIGFENLSGSGGGISIATTPVHGPQDPVILKSPIGSGAPAVSRSATAPSSLACSQGSWASYPSSFVYAEPVSYAYQWLLNGAAIAGATAGTLTATSPGAYTCTVTATNQAGSASQTSTAAATVTAASVKLTVKPRTAKAKAGKLAKFAVKALNQGDLATGNAKVCVKLSKKAKKALKAPKCKKLGVVGALTTRTAKLKIKVKPTAENGSYKLKLLIKGSAGKAVKATVKVIG